MISYGIRQKSTGLYYSEKASIVNRFSDKHARLFATLGGAQTKCRAGRMNWPPLQDLEIVEFELVELRTLPPIKCA